MKSEYTITNKFKGNWFIFIILLLIFWPAAIIYFVVKRKPVKTKIEKE